MSVGERTVGRRAGRKAKDYLDLAWTIELKRASDGSVFARVVECPGCMTVGDDDVDALKRLRVALRLWLESELEQGHPIPEPLEGTREYSGKFTLRTSPLVHRLAAEAADGLGVSLNEFASEALALAAGAAVGLRSRPDRPTT